MPHLWESVDLAKRIGCESRKSRSDGHAGEEEARVRPTGRTKTTAREIARHELSSQHGTRLSRPERRTRTIPSNIRAYRADVRTHLAANRPSGGFGSGLVAIAFRLSVDGKIRSAQIKEAPEAEDLHERALTALYRAVPFPAAPGNATSKYRAFTVSFIFE